MPMKKALYPPTWKQIADEIKARDEWTCQECGLKHGMKIIRSPHRPDEWREATTKDYLNFPDLITRIVMTVHHIGIDKEDGTPGSADDKMDCRPDNLITLCPRCHFLADQAGNLLKSSLTRIAHKRQSQVGAGQGELF